MKILIADDSSEKIKIIINAIERLPERSMVEIDYELALLGARRRLMQTFYDLLILDLNMPNKLGEDSDMTAGIQFVDELMGTERIKKPLDIVVLSAFDSSLRSFKEEIEKSGFVALHFDETSTDWQDILRSKVCHLLNCHRQRRYVPRHTACDVFLITAVAVETNAVLSWGYKWDKLSIEGDSTQYRHACVDCNGKQMSIVHVQLSEMGMTSAAAMVSKAIMHFEPRYIMMTGIAAGVEKDVRIGDIMVATEVWDYSSGKYEEITENGVKRVRLSPDPKYISMPKAISDSLEFLDYSELLKTIRLSYQGVAPSHELNVRFGQMACGPTVVASEEIVNEQVRAHARKALGLDMESYGVYYAAQTMTKSGVDAIVVKSVCDFADKSKDDKNQDYAAYTSAFFTKHLIETVLGDGIGAAPM